MARCGFSGATATFRAQLLNNLAGRGKFLLFFPICGSSIFQEAAGRAFGARAAPRIVFEMPAVPLLLGQDSGRFLHWILLDLPISSSRLLLLRSLW